MNDYLFKIYNGILNNYYNLCIFSKLIKVWSYLLLSEFRDRYRAFIEILQRERMTRVYI